MSKIVRQNPNNPKTTPQVYKQVEFNEMIELISSGLWGTTNLSKALHVDITTIVEWKKRPEVQEAHRQAIKKFLRRRTDVEKILSEMDVETPQEPSLTQINNYMSLTDEQLDTIIRSKAGKAGVIAATTGEGEAEGGEPA